VPPPELPILKGTLDVLALKALSWGEMHGFGILAWLEQRSGGVLGIEDSALYQALHRMEERGLIAATWRVTENKRRARFYKLTAKGRQQLRAQSSNWFRYSDAVTDILRAVSQG
jgi:transcriptional regulator